MDAIVLAPMPQTPVQSPGQNGQTAGRNDASFGPVLSRAISGNASGQKSTAAGTSRDTSNSADEQLIDIEQIDDPGELEAFLAANNLTFEALPPELQQMIAAAFPAFAAVSGEQLSARNGMLPPGMSLFPRDQLPQGLDRLLDQLSGGGESQPLPPQGLGLASQKQELTLILSQLQQIISANETAVAIVEQLPGEEVTLDDVAALTIRLQTAGDSPRAAMTREAMAASGGLFGLQPGRQDAAAAAPPVVEAAAATVAAGRQPLPPAVSAEVETTGTPAAPTLRQEMQPVTGAATTSVADDNGQAARQNSQQDNNPATLQPGSTAAASAASPSDQPAQAGVFSASLQDSVTAQQPQSHSGTVTLPSGTTVSEQQILNQVVQRFQMTSRLQSTRINIRLHPAELGELKIDLVVREGSIKASVFAQNQNAQEILERNMPKLRTTLEQHGFSIDEIVVAFRAETTKDFDLFDGQSARGQQFSFSDNANPQLATFEAVLDNSLAGTEAPDAGLSIRA